jgi:hypothetical protein
MELARFTCEQCGDKTKTLAIHHRVYRIGSEPWAYPDHELVCLCEECHDYEHNMPDEDRTAYDSEARAEGFIDFVDLKLEHAKCDREAQRLGFENDCDRQLFEYRRSQKEAA